MGAYEKSLLKLRAGNIATRGLLKEARLGGFQSTTSLIDSIGGNLATNVAAMGSTMTRQNARQLRALAAVADRTAAGNARDVHGGQRTAQNLFGGAITGLIAPTVEQTAGHSKASRIALAGAARAGVTTAKGANTILGIMQAGVAEANAGAAAQTADALAYRAKNDAQVIAQQQQMVLQSKLDFQNWRRQQDYLKKLETKQPPGSEAAGVATVAELTVSAAVTMRQYLATHPDATVDDLVGQVTAGDASLAGNAGALTVLSELARQAKSSVDPNTGQTIPGYSRANEAEDIFNSILLLYPNYKKVDQLKATIKAGLDAGWSAAQVAAAASATASASGGTGSVFSSPYGPDNAYGQYGRMAVPTP